MSPTFRHKSTSRRRGNTLVLVTGILVLLVIIATAYVTRTQAGRTTAKATEEAGLRDDNAHTIANTLAQEICDALFVQEIDPTDPVLVPGRPAPAGTRRFSLIDSQIRYGVDSNVNFPYNIAPYQVVPFTNWPDPDGTVNFPYAAWPPGPGNPNYNGAVNGILTAEGNPVGNPGIGDTRWLCDLEPL